MWTSAVALIVMLCGFFTAARAGEMSTYFWNQTDMDRAQAITGGTAAAPIAIISSGLDYRIPFIREGIAKNTADPIDSTDNDDNGFVDDYFGVDVAKGSGDPLETDPSTSVGTNIASILHTFAPNAKYIPIKVFDDLDESFTTIDTVRTAVAYAVSRHARIMVWGAYTTTADSDAVCNAVRYAGAGRILVIASAGSVGGEVSNTKFPGGCSEDNLLTVASSDENSQLAYFSSYGIPWVHLAAPGVNIPVYKAGGKEGLVSGGLAAASITAAIANLVLSERPNLLPNDLKKALMRGGDTIESLKNKVTSGKRINAFGALSANSWQGRR